MTESDEVEELMHTAWSLGIADKVFELVTETRIKYPKLTTIELYTDAFNTHINKLKNANKKK
tara:strand:- start:503 stop:688 length:186 start_codon:yes stop_codon:yes gene_type:complete